MVPLAGGVSQQLTKGSGPDIGISVSADNQKLIYLQQQRIGHVWSAGLKTLSSRQLTFDDRLIAGVALSPDGRKIAIVMAEIDPLKPGQNLYLQDMDGSNRRQLTFSEAPVIDAAWSPDGKWISYSSSPIYSFRDSVTTYLIEAANPGSAKSIDPGMNSIWLDAERLVVRNVKFVNGTRSTFDELAFIDGRPRETLFGDSTMAVGVGPGNTIIYIDDHRRSKGAWAAPPEYAKDRARYKPKKLAEVKGTVIAQNRHSVYIVNSRNELWRTDPMTGKSKFIQGSLPGLDRNAVGSVSDDDREFIYVTFQLSGKLVMMENIFR
jgi:tricorn protease-like protein